MPVKAPDPSQTVGSPLAVHAARCDLCGSRIAGDRYKCASCPDFDSCSNCFIVTDLQHPNHSFIKITKPEDLIHRLVGKPEVAIHNATCNACKKCIYGTRFKCMHLDCPDYNLCQNCEALPVAVHPTNHPMMKMNTPDTIAHSFHQPRITVSHHLLSAAFVEDITIPDFKRTIPGTVFTKSWQLMNDGDCEWPESTELIFVAGHLLFPTGSNDIPVPVGKIGPGQTIVVETGELKAPELPGTYVAHWRLRADGELFGTSVCVAIIVTRRRQLASQQTQRKKKTRN